MQHIDIVLAILVVSYLLGSIPFGWIVVKLTTGRDIRGIASGRTGGTNVWRAAGILPGLITGILDIVKGAATVWLVRWWLPVDFPFYRWIEIAAPLAGILGHNYSIYLLERHETTGKMRLRGGAGGATCLGGAVGLWSPALFFILPLGLVIYLVIGYASVTTMSVALLATLVFLVQAIRGALPWEYIVFGLLAEVMVVWALRPNIQRLREGNERQHGLIPWLKKRNAEKQKG
jgi:glycerol-3-phosphate acyltransferase PlsY